VLELEKQYIRRVWKYLAVFEKSKPGAEYTEVIVAAVKEPENA